MGPDKQDKPKLDVENLVADPTALVSVDWHAAAGSWVGRDQSSRLPSSTGKFTRFSSSSAGTGNSFFDAELDEGLANEGSADEYLEPELQRKAQLDQLLQQLFATTNGYSLGTVLSIAEPNPQKLTAWELVAVAFRAVSGFEQDHIWANCLFSRKEYLPLKAVIDTLSLCSPSYAAREDAILCFSQKGHQDLETIFTIAAQQEPEDSLRRQIERILRMQPTTSAEHPQLSTLIFRAANAQSEESFANTVQAVMNEYHEDQAAPALAALANTTAPERRAWALNAFRNTPKLARFEPLLAALPVSARNSG